ncbi:MAG: bifunctional glutamate N-acetyltransferase/amino-acid acetyltransferase ArgJ [Desulfobacteraceae bacterium]|nr:bifunctional glutamate N-acetyltransferase/amino-acid acetyltransferase ArgJ [Desulfobacteraceae bacterium]
MSDTLSCKGFKAASLAAGIKVEGRLDLGLIYSTAPASAAGVFTSNLVKAAPVVLSKKNMSGGKARAIIVNSGNANCCTGAQGMTDALEIAETVAGQLGLSPDEIVPASTGVIGAPLPADKIRKAIPDLVNKLEPAGFEGFARAIMTTDTVPKLEKRQVQIDGQPVCLVAVAKGAGMIRPDMATMLCFVCTDAGIEPELLQTVLKSSVDKTLNRITVDGDTSTNDTVAVLANGASGVDLTSEQQIRQFQSCLDDLLMDIARALVKDGEGVTKVVDITVCGAASEADALKMADTIAHSALVKTAFFGQDANWGRILMAAGRSGVKFDFEKTDLYFNSVQMAAKGMTCGPDAEKTVTRIMKDSEFSVTLDLHDGPYSATMITSDFSVDYVKINADYRS